MTNDQYTELVGFLGAKFAGIERRLDAHDEQFVEVRRHATALFEQAREERRAMAEGLEAGFNARFDALEQKVARIEPLERKVDSLDAFVRATLADHEARLQAPE